MSRSFSVFLSWHSSFCHLKHTVRNAGAIISVTNWNSNITWLASCSLRWHGLNLLKSVYFAVSPQVLHDFCFPVYFCVLHVCMWIWTSEVSFRCLPQLCPPYFLRQVLTELELTLLAGLDSQWALGMHLSPLLSAERRSRCLCIRLLCGSWGPNSCSRAMYT